MRDKVCLLLLGIACALQLSAMSAASDPHGVTIYWTDRGINSRNNNKSVTESNTYTVKMPIGDQRPSTDIGWNAWAAGTSEDISSFVQHSISSGQKEVEVLAGLNMNTASYFGSPKELAASQAFMLALGQALSNVKGQYDARVIGVFGSEATQAFTDVSLTMSGRNLNPVDSAILINGRASVENTISACDVLASCTIVTSTLDWPSSEMGMGDQFRRIANRSYAAEVVDRTNGKVKLIDTDADGFHLIGSPHVALQSPSQRDRAFRYREYANGKWSSIQTANGQVLYQKLIGTPSVPPVVIGSTSIGDTNASASDYDSRLSELNSQIAAAMAEENVCIKEAQAASRIADSCHSGCSLDEKTSMGTWAACMRRCAKPFEDANAKTHRAQERTNHLAQAKNDLVSLHLSKR